MASNESSTPLLRRLSLLVRLACGLLLLIVAIGVTSLLYAKRPAPTRTNVAERPNLVGVVTLEPVSVVRSWDGYGTARALDSVDLAAEVTGRVVERPAEIEAGIRIPAGTVVVQLERTDYEQSLRMVQERIVARKAQLAGLAIEESRLRERVELATNEAEVLEREYRRAADAQGRGGGSSSEVERNLAAWVRAQRELTQVLSLLDLVPSRRAQLEAEQRRDEAEESRANRDIERTTIRSPFDATIQSVEVEQGEWLSMGNRVARLVDLRRIEVPLRLPLGAHRVVRVGDSVVLHADNAGGDTWNGVLVRLAPEADAERRTVTAYVEVTQDPEGSGSLLLPGQFVLGRVRGGTDERRIVVPRRAMNGDRVLLVRDESGEARATGVEVRVLHFVDARYPHLDVAETQWAVVESGLVSGDRVIVTNLDQIREGHAIRPESVTTEEAAR